MTPQTPVKGPQSPAEPQNVHGATRDSPSASEATHDTDARKAVERALDLANYWEQVLPETPMTRGHAAAVLREVIA